MIKVQVNPGSGVDGGADLTEQIESEVQSALKYYEDRITRVEVFLGDENSPEKGGGADKRCTMEARLSGLKPHAVTAHSDSIAEAVSQAADKLQNAIKTTIGRIQDSR